MNAVSSRCAVPGCPHTPDPTSLGYCLKHGNEFFPKRTNAAGQVVGRRGVEVWNANMLKRAFLCIWYTEDRPEQQLNTLVVDAGIYRTNLPDAEPGTRQVEKGVKVRCILNLESVHSVEDAFTLAFKCVETEPRYLEIRSCPTYARQLREKVAKVMAETAPLKDAPVFGK